MSGEHGLIQARNDSVDGSSPRERGAQLLPLIIGEAVGIIPA